MESMLVGAGAVAYFNRVFELLKGMEITDRPGTVLRLDEGVRAAVDLILETLAARRKVMVMGNGGSAAIASHMHNDLSKSVGVRCLIFNEPPLLTALANDHGYATVFERPVDMWAEEGDVLFAISSSGNSANILRAVKAAADKGCRAITLSGFKPDNALRKLGTVNFYVNAASYGLVEVAHSTLAHYISDVAMVINREKAARKAESL